MQECNEKFASRQELSDKEQKMYENGQGMAHKYKTNTFIHVYIHTYTCIHIHVYTYINTHTRPNTNIYTNI